MAQFLKFVEDLKSALFKCRTCDIALAWLQVLMLSLPGTVVLLLIQPLLGLRALYISMGWGTSVWTGLHSFFFFFFQICTLQVGMAVSWGSQETRGLLIRVATIGHKYCHGEGNTNTPGKLSRGKAHMVSTVWEGL